jgi:hypothetical protein
MISIMVVLESHESWLHISLGAVGGIKITTEWECFACGSAVCLTLRQDLEIELPHCEAQNVTLNSDYWQQVVKIVIGGVSTDLGIHIMCLFVYLSRMLLQGAISTTMFNTIRIQVDLLKVDVGM